MVEVEIDFNSPDRYLIIWCDLQDSDLRIVDKHAGTSVIVSLFEYYGIGMIPLTYAYDLVNLYNDDFVTYTDMLLEWSR